MIKPVGAKKTKSPGKVRKDPTVTKGDLTKLTEKGKMQAIFEVDKPAEVKEVPVVDEDKENAPANQNEFLQLLTTAHSQVHALKID